MASAIINGKKVKFVKGMLVTTDYERKDAAVVRRVISVRKDNYVTGPDGVTRSGLRVAADAGERCAHCGLIPARPIMPGIDASWYKVYTGDTSAVAIAV